MRRHAALETTQIKRLTEHVTRPCVHEPLHVSVESVAGHPEDGGGDAEGTKDLGRIGASEVGLWGPCGVRLW